MSITKELTERDYQDILYDLTDASIFFNKPLKVEFPEAKLSYQVGNGLGGYSWTLFHRGADCTVCGNCCKRTFRRIWFWWDTEDKRPDGLGSLTVLLNNHPITLWLHINEQGEDRCDFLVDDTWNGLEVGYCSLHRTLRGNIKPVHCHLHPLTGVYKVNTVRGTRYLLSRRLPHRNFRWPQCPIPVAEVPYLSKDFADDEFGLRRISKALHDVPGSFSHMAYYLWRDEAMKALSGNPTSENIFFEDRF